MEMYLGKQRKGFPMKENPAKIEKKMLNQLLASIFLH